MMINGRVVYCDCHGSEKLAEINGDRLVVKDRRHGEQHMAVIPLREVLDLLPDQALIDKLQNRGYSVENIIKRAAEPETTRPAVLKPAAVRT